MVYDEGLAQRIEEFLDETETPGLTQKKMFGGVGYMVFGNMACGVHKDKLIVRVGPEKYKKSLEKEHTGLFDITGRAMTGWVMVDPAGYESDETLTDWVKTGIEFALTLPAK